MRVSRVCAAILTLAAIWPAFAASEMPNSVQWAISDSTGVHSGTTIPLSCAGTPTAIPTPGIGVGYICGLPLLGAKTFGAPSGGPPLQSSGGAVWEYLKYSVSLVGGTGPVPIVVHGDFAANIEPWSYTNAGAGVEAAWSIVSEDGKTWGLDTSVALYSLRIGTVQNYNITANLTSGLFTFASTNGIGFSIANGQKGAYGPREGNFYEGDHWTVSMDGSFVMTQNLNVTLSLSSSVIGNSWSFIDPVFAIDPAYQALHPEVSLAFSSGIVNAPVPEVDTSALLIVGLGLIGALKKRRG